MPSPVATVHELWRYPLKGMRGEQVSALLLDATGAVGDRRFAVQSTGAPPGKPLLSGAERAAMLLWQARIADDATEVVSPTGEAFPVSSPAMLRRMQALLPSGHTLSLVTSARPLTDVRPLAILGQATIAALAHDFGRAIDPRRFRANLLLSGIPPFAEDALVDKRVQVGERAVLHVRERTPRCRIVTLDPDTAEPNPQLMRYLSRTRNGRVGVYATVEQPALLKPGDPVVLL